MFILLETKCFQKISLNLCTKQQNRLIVEVSIISIVFIAEHLALSEKHMSQLPWKTTTPAGVK